MNHSPGASDQAVAKSRLVLADVASIRGLSIRHLSSYTKAHGVPTKLVFPLLPDRATGVPSRLTLEQMLGTYEFLQAVGATHFGCYLMTSHFRAFKELVQFLRTKRWPGRILAGGVHPTMRPQETLLQGVDYVVVGPGERALVDILRGRPFEEIGGLVHRAPDGIRKNPVNDESLVELDALPFPDYDFEDHFVIQGRTADVLTLARFRRMSGWGGTFYYLTTTRGCPYCCSYCCNVERKRLRRASVNHVMDELRQAKRCLPFLCGVNIQDDSFFMGSDEWLQEFSQRLRQEFDWPFIARIMPRYATRDRLQMLKAGGLRYVSIGLQGSERLNRDLYKRSETNDRFVAACNFMAEVGIVYVVDVILDVVYETEDDLREVARTLNRLPRPFKVLIYSMTPFPGSTFHDKVVADGLLERFAADAYEWSFTRSRRDAYKTPLYWRQLMERVIPLNQGPAIDSLIEAGPADAAAAAEVARLHRRGERKMIVAEWMRQHMPYLFDKAIALEAAVRRVWRG